MKKLVIVVMGQDCQKYLSLTLKCVNTADAIVYCDGGSNDQSFEIAKEHGADVIQNLFDQEDKAMNGKQRNFYLEHLKKHYKGYWCLAIDSDEVVADIEKIKEFIQTADEKTLYNIHMRHLVENLVHEDATIPRHYVPHRLFKIDKALSYPLGEHVILQGKDYGSGTCDATTIWHMAYCEGVWAVKKRYEKNLTHSNIHKKGYLDSWYKAHLFGQYKKQVFDPNELPVKLLEHFHIDPDELYFKKRILEHKHWLEAVSWKFILNPKNALLLGCGRGARVCTLNHVGVDAKGVEISHWAVNNSYYPKKIFQGDITEPLDISLCDPADLVVAYDVLEHLTPEGLDNALINALTLCKKFLLCSIPFVGDPNLEADPTHIIRETKDWWKEKIESFGFESLPVVDDFLYKDQLLLFRVKA